MMQSFINAGLNRDELTQEVYVETYVFSAFFLSYKHFLQQPSSR